MARLRTMLMTLAVAACSWSPPPPRPSLVSLPPASTEPCQRSKPARRETAHRAVRCLPGLDPTPKSAFPLVRVDFVGLAGLEPAASS
jgi:hypothetical protein